MSVNPLKRDRERGGNGSEQLNNARASAFGAVRPCVAFLACQNSILEEGKEEGDRAREGEWDRGEEYK